MTAEFINRIDKCLSGLQGKKAALTMFLPPVGFQSLAPHQLMQTLAKSGADILELGVPFRDPVADGPVIDALYQTLIKDNIGLDYCLDQIGAFRDINSDTPVILMSYFNPILQKGIELFCSEAAAAGVDGVIVVDYSDDDYETLYSALNNQHLAFIPIIAPDSGRHHPDLKPPFHYLLSASATTGSEPPDLAHLAETTQVFRQASERYFVGFGLKNPNDVNTLSRDFDGVIIGSELVRQLNNASNTNEIISYTQALSEACYR